MDGNRGVVYAQSAKQRPAKATFEAICFAKERSLPMVFVVEDNRIAISTNTTRTNPLVMGVLNAVDWVEVDGCDVDAVAAAGEAAVQLARAGQGPAFIWCHVERFSNHSSADDQRMYRAADELVAMQERDPVVRYQERLIAEGLLTAAEAAALEAPA